MKGGVTVEYLESLPISELQRKLDIFIKIKKEENKAMEKETQKK